MSNLHHPNIVALKYYFYSTNNNETYLNLIMDYYPETVYSVIKTYARHRQSMPISFIRLYSYQLLRSLAYLHCCGNTCHRDIKPQNLLVDHSTGKLVLIDFGSAKKLEPGTPSVSYICSRYYRAPELIFGSTHYGTAIDLWSSGCVIAELIIGNPLFPGETGVDQLVEIIRVLGTPSKEQIRAMNDQYTEDEFPYVKAQPWTTVFKVGVPTEIIDLISKLLVYVPSDRLTALESLAHPFFDPLRSDEDVAGSHLKLFDFSDAEIIEMKSAGLYEKICPYAYRRDPESPVKSGRF